MKKVYIVHYNNRCWHNFDILITKEDSLIEKIQVNYVCQVDGDFIKIYDATGGHDNIHRGDILRKIFIGDCEMERIELPCTYVNDDRKDFGGQRATEYVFPEKLKGFYNNAPS